MTEQEARAEQGYTEVDPFDLSDDQSDEVTALAEATVKRDALARAYDPDAFTDRALDQTRHAGAVIQWAARRHLAVEAADRVIASGILAERSRAVEAAPSDTDAEPLTNEALWDFADDLLELWNIEDLNPPSLTEQFRDRFVARFGASQPVQVEVNENLNQIRIHAELLRKAPGVPTITQRYLLLLLEEYDAALGGGESNG